jgi:hypothetical protein
MDCFSGKSTDTPIGTFIAHFMLIAKQNRWHKSEWASEMVAKLRGEARALILPEADSKVPKFSKLVKTLQKALWRR